MIGRSPRPSSSADTATTRFAIVRHALLHTLPGRLLLIGLVVRLLGNLLQPLGLPESLVALVDQVAAFAILLGGGYFVLRLAGTIRRRLLWRVRRKLILSYVLLGVVPVLLIVTFFVLCGLLLFFHVSSYLVHDRLRNVTEQAEFQAKATALELQRAPSLEAAEAVVARRQINIATQYPGTSMAVVPLGPEGCAGDAAAGGGATRASRQRLPVLMAGPWAHLDAPDALPGWVECAGFGGLLAFVPAGQPPVETGGPMTKLAIRAAAMPDGAAPDFAVVMDVPINEALERRMRDETGIQLRRVSIVPTSADDVRPAVGRPAGTPAAAQADESGSLSWVTLLDFTDWATGRTAPVTWAIALDIPQVYDRLSVTQARIGNRSFGQILLVLLTIVAALFLVIEFVALVMGFALARSITGSVHELFVGTERVRAGDFTHKIRIEARDQLGELADSFNAMTNSIEDLLRQSDEKRRLEGELRIAHKIQMSLLPQGQLAMPGFSVTALCQPAREVGGDYYDLFPLGPRRLAVLIADVSGKGTSAALYMAELKGLMLSLSENYHSPRELLVQANRIIAANLDTRSFITMTYAVIDLDEGTMTYARAGHTPLIYLPAGSGPRRARILAPDGMVLGLQLDGGEHFARLLEEATIPLTAGDLFVFFTDGISEAMNDRSDCFEEARLGALVEEHGDLPCDQLRERIIREVQTFSAGQPAHDDMTMILVRVQQVGAPRAAGAAAAASAGSAAG